MTPEQKAELEVRAGYMKSINVSASSMLALFQQLEWRHYLNQTRCSVCQELEENGHGNDCELRYTILKLIEENPQPREGGYLATLREGMYNDRG